MKNIDKKHTKSIILKKLITYGSLTRTELLQKTNFSRTTISTTISELINLHILRETKTQPSTGGRPAISIEFERLTHVIIGAELRQTHKFVWNIGAFDLTFNPIKTIEVPAIFDSPESLIKNFYNHMMQFVKQLNLPIFPIIGIGLPGLIDTTEGTMISTPELKWQNVHIGASLEKALNWNVSVINNFKSRGLYESRYGEGKNFSNLIYLGINNGIGGSLFHNNKLVLGAFGGAGEIGHTTIEPAGAYCTCGNRGCLEIMAAAPGINRHYHDSLPENKRHDRSKKNNNQNHTENICLASENGDQLSRQSIETAANYLGISMANLINTYNPECLILGGFIPQNSPLYASTAEKVMRNRALLPLSKSTTVYISDDVQYAGPLGAAHNALEKHMSFSLFSE